MAEVLYAIQSDTRGRGFHPTDRQTGCPCAWHTTEEGTMPGKRWGLCPTCQAKVGHGESFSAPEGVDVIVEADRGAGAGAVTVAALLAATALDPHDVPREALSVRAVEAQANGTGEGGRAAAAIGAGAAGTGPIPLGRGTSCKGNADWFLGTNRSLAFFPPLNRQRNRATVNTMS